MVRRARSPGRTPRIACSTSGRRWLAAPEVGFGDVVCYLKWLEMALLIGVKAAGPGSIEGSALVADTGAG
jgi:hypothetical protein